MANADGLRQKMLRYSDELGRLATDEMFQDLQNNAPVSGADGPHLRDLLTMTRVGDAPNVSYIAASPADWSSYSEEGTDPHIIQGHPFLSFYWRKVGARVVRAYVNHPGNPARPWFDPIMQKWHDYLQRNLDQVSVG